MWHPISGKIILILLILGAFADKNELEDEIVELREEGLRIHNELRARHGSPPLKLDSELNSWTQEIAEKLADNYHQAISFDWNVGYNFRVQPCHRSYDIKLYIKDWYSGQKDYDYNNPGFTKNAQEFTQIVWRSSEKLGLGIAKKGRNKTLIAYYSPKGNINGKFAENVDGPKSFISWWD